MSNSKNRDQGRAATELPSQARSRMTMIALFMVFFGPIFLAMFLYKNLDLWNPSSAGSYGELMVPVQPLAMLDGFDNQSKEKVSAATIEKRWTLIYVAKGGCDLSCEASLFKVRQLRILLGRELSRVQYMFLALDENAARAVDALAAEHPRLMQVTARPEVVEQQAAAFGDAAIGNLFLIDPNGNLVMRYTAESEVDGMLKDLHKLLKVSKIG